LVGVTFGLLPGSGSPKVIDLFVDDDQSPTRTGLQHNRPDDMRKQMTGGDVLSDSHGFEQLRESARKCALGCPNFRTDSQQCANLRISTFFLNSGDRSDSLKV
jgi:hypothetical protein